MRHADRCSRKPRSCTRTRLNGSRRDKGFTLARFTAQWLDRYLWLRNVRGPKNDAMSFHWADSKV